MVSYCSRVTSPRAYRACRISFAFGCPVAYGTAETGTRARCIAQTTNRVRLASNPTQKIRFRINPIQPQAPQLPRDPRLPVWQRRLFISHLFLFIWSEIFYRFNFQLSYQRDSACNVDHLSIDEHFAQRLGHRNTMVSVPHEIDSTGMDQVHRGQTLTCQSYGCHTQPAAA